MDTQGFKTKTICMYKNKKTDNFCYYYKTLKNIQVNLKYPIYKPLIILRVLNSNIVSLYNIILINIKFNTNIPESSINFKSCIFETINNKSVLNIDEFGTIELNNIYKLSEKTFNCFVYSKLNTLSILLIDYDSPNFIHKYKNEIKFINFLPNKTILNIPCHPTISPITFSNFKYISRQIDKYSPWEFYGKRLSETAVLLIDNNVNNKILGSLKHQTSFIKDLYIISTSLIPSKSNVNLELVNIKVYGSLFIILPDNYGITVKYSSLNIIKQL